MAVVIAAVRVIVFIPAAVGLVVAVVTAVVRAVVVVKSQDVEASVVATVVGPEEVVKIGAPRYFSIDRNIT